MGVDHIKRYYRQGGQAVGSDEAEMVHPDGREGLGSGSEHSV